MSMTNRFKRAHPLRSLTAALPALWLALAPAQAMQTADASPAPPPPAAADQGQPVAVFTTRQSVVPRAGDEGVLKQGLSLHIGSMGPAGMTIVEYGVQGGKIVYTVTSGRIDAKTDKVIAKAISKLQKKM